MQRVVAAWGFIAILAACGHPEANLSSDQAINQADWVGTWSCTLTTTEHCSGKTPATGTEPVTFSAFGDAGISTTSSANCVCNFTLDGDNATLSNGPVMCGAGPDLQFVISTYTLTCDGGALWGEFDGSVFQPATGTCPTSTTMNCAR